MESDPNFSYCSYCYPVSVPTQMFTGDVAGQLIEGIAEDVPVLKPTVNVTQSLKIAVSHEGDHDSEVSFNAEDDAQLRILCMIKVTKQTLNAITNTNFLNLHSANAE